jgi:hypothetical protein
MWDPNMVRRMTTSTRNKHANMISGR